jgi:hypothetical protein
MTGQRFAGETSRRDSGGVRSANNLPLIRTSFVGRESPLADLGMLLDGAAVVTLVGQAMLHERFLPLVANP